MSKLNYKGPENQGFQSGCGLGNCRRNKMNDEQALQVYGIGMGLRRQAGGGQGQGRRLRAGIKIND